MTNGALAARVEGVAGPKLTVTYKGGFPSPHRLAGLSPRLGVNVDHVATVRNARGGALPDPVRAALMAIDAVLRFLNKRPKSLLFLSLFLILIGSRAAAINYAGNSTPLWDEWEGEWANLLKPYIQGKLTVESEQ